MPQIFSEIPLHLIFESSVSFCCEKKSASQPKTAVPLSKTALQAKSKAAKTTAIVPAASLRTIQPLPLESRSPFPLIFEKAILTFASFSLL